MFIDVRHPYTNKLLFRYDPERQLIEIGERGKTIIIDLTQIRAENAAERPQQPATTIT